MKHFVFLFLLFFCLVVDDSFAQSRGMTVAPTWQRIQTPQSPSARMAPVAYDWRDDARLVVLSGGLVADGAWGTWSKDLWLFDGTTWTQGTESPPAKPPRCYSTFDFSLWALGPVEYGGVNTWPSGAKGNRETWPYQTLSTGGGVWMLSPIPKECSAERYGHSAAYHAAKGKLVVTGGLDRGRGVGETWVLMDDRRWSRSLGSSPPMRAYAHMVYDSARHRIVLFGGKVYAEGSQYSDVDPTEVFRAEAGTDQSYTVYDDTWAWDGSWKELTDIGVSPQARYSHGMAYDYKRGVVVLFGGRAGSGTYLNDTWELTNEWRPVSPATSPVARAFPGLASWHDGVILYGGVIWPNTLFGDTWRFGN